MDDKISCLEWCMLIKAFTDFKYLADSKHILHDELENIENYLFERAPANIDLKDIL